MKFRAVWTRCTMTEHNRDIVFQPDGEDPNGGDGNEEAGDDRVSFSQEAPSAGKKVRKKKKKKKKQPVVETASAEAPNEDTDAAKPSPPPKKKKKKKKSGDKHQPVSQTSVATAITSNQSVSHTEAHEEDVPAPTQ